MSADNFYLIRKHPKGGFTFTQEFASNDGYSDVRPTNMQFDSVDAATNAAIADGYTEYGLTIHSECEVGE